MEARLELSGVEVALRKRRSTIAVSTGLAGPQAHTQRWPRRAQCRAEDIATPRRARLLRELGGENLVSPESAR